MRSVTRLFVIVAALSWCGERAIEAQVVTGNIIGNVTDQSKAVLPGVTVTALSPALPGGPQTTVTGTQGEFRFSSLPIGDYEIRLELSGFTTYVERELRVTVGGTIERNITLPLASVAETITVSGQSPIVDPRQTAVIKSLTKEAVEAVPISRSGLGSFMAAMPGVTTTNYNYGGTSVNVMGSNANDTSYMIDGMLTNHPSTGSPWAWHDLDAVEEVNLVALGASTEYQMAQGGVMNLVTKSGTNVFRADGSYFLAPSGLTSAPVKLPCNCPLGETGYKLYKYTDWSAHAGGPVMKDRLWFHTGITQTGPSNRQPGAPDRPEQYWLIQRETRTMTKLNYKVTPKVQFQQNIGYEYWNWYSPTFPTTVTPIESLQVYTGDIRYFGSELAATLSSSTMLTARYLRNSTPYGYVGNGPNLEADATSQTIAGHLDQATGVSSVNATVAPSRAYEPIRDDVNVKLNHYRLMGRFTHNIRGGLQIARNREFGQQVWPGDVLFLDFNARPDQLRDEGATSYAAAFKSTGLWAEDEVTVNRFTFVVGARFDNMRAYSPDAPQFDPVGVSKDGGLCRCIVSFEKTGGTVAGLGDTFTWRKVSPRGGVNVRLRKDGKTVLRATAGRYYRAIYLNDFTGVHPGIATVTIKRFDPAVCPGATVATATPNCYPAVISVTDPRANIGVDPDIDAPYNDQYSVGIEHELMRNVGISVNYVRKSAEQLLGWRDTGGDYGVQTVTAPNGQTITALPLLNSPSARKFVRANTGYFNRYNGLLIVLTRRMSNRWLLNANYTYSKADGYDIPPGASVFATTTGQDPNDNLGRRGRLLQDRPHMFGMTGVYEIPKVEVQFSGNFSVVSGYPFGAQVPVTLPQGRRNVYYEEIGSHRTPTENWLIFRASKILLRREARRIEAGVELRNALQQTRDSSIASQVITSPLFGQQNIYPIPRQLVFRVRGFF